MITLTEELLQVSVGGVVDGGAEVAAIDEDEEQKHLLKDYVAGDIVMAYFEKDNNFQPAEIDAVTSEGNFAITWLGFPSSSAEVFAAPAATTPIEFVSCGCPPATRRILCCGEASCW